MLEAYDCCVHANAMACFIVKLHLEKHMVGGVFIYSCKLSSTIMWWKFLLINFLCARDKVVVLVTESMKNPQSALCKTAIMSSADIFKGYPEHVIDILDPLVLQILSLEL